MKPGPILGIDFGTTNTSAAYFDDSGKLKLVPCAEKSFVMPSIAWFHAGDKALIGQAARTQIVDDPRHTIFGSKRFLEEIGSTRFLEEIGLENFLAGLTPAERRELKRRLQ